MEGEGGRLCNGVGYMYEALTVSIVWSVVHSERVWCEVGGGYQVV